MNALANSQTGELEKFLRAGYPDGKGPVTVRRYTGQERKRVARRDKPAATRIKKGKGPSPTGWERALLG